MKRGLNKGYTVDKGALIWILMTVRNPGNDIIVLWMSKPFFNEIISLSISHRSVGETKRVKDFE